MKCSIPEISWHNREPVLSADLQPLNTINNDFYRLATGGSDNLVLIWKVKILSTGQAEVTVLSELTRHQRSVNCVKWSPHGEMLASADDDANIILWQLKTDNIPSLDERENEFEEKWSVFKVLRGHKEDVYDLCWSPNSDKLLSGSVDNTAIVWDVAKGTNEHIIKDHRGFVQGVAWDPKSDFIATLCSDRLCRVFDRNGRRVRARIGRGKLPVLDSSEFYDKEVKYFHDDTFKTYFRRLNFTPDGSLLLVPSGAVETEERKNALFGTFAFALDSLNNPVCILPSGKQCSIVVTCCPVLFELRENGPKPVINLPYRMIIAVATDSDVILYDTQQMTPCVHLQNIHYTRLTDLSWSADGLLLVATSTDGFLTFVTFEEGELGTPYVKDESDVEDSVLNMSGCDLLPADEPEMKVQVVEEIEKPKEKPKKPSFLQQWTQQGNKRKITEDKEEIDNKKVKTKLISNTNSNSSSMDGISEQNDVEMKAEEVKVPVKVQDTQEIKTQVTKKRITPILISKDVLKKPLSPPEAPLKDILKSEDQTEVKPPPKRRIQPIKIAELQKDTQNDMSKVQDCKKQDEKIDAIDLDKVSASSEQVAAAVTPKTNSETVEKTKTSPNNDKILNPTSISTKPPTKKTQTPQTQKPTCEKSTLSSSKKKKPPNTLFNYLKPINTTPAETKISSESGQKPEFKPQNLFGHLKKEIELTNGDSNSDCTEEKMKVSSNLFTPRSRSQQKSTNSEISKTPIPVLETTNTELPEDFILRVDDDVIHIEDSNEPTEKENEDAVKKLQPESLPVKAETKRRVPLITLSSPKNKKKSAD